MEGRIRKKSSKGKKGNWENALLSGKEHVLKKA